VLQGIAAAPGLAVARLLIVDNKRAAFARRRIARDEVRGELDRVSGAVAIARQQLTTISQGGAMRPLGESQAILDAYLAMLSDPMLHEKVQLRIEQDRLCAEWAVATASDEIVQLFSSSAASERDLYIQERKHDVEFVAERLLQALVGESAPLLGAGVDTPSIILARDLSPADTAAMGRMPILGFITERGTATSHTAIMARALGIPAIVGVDSPRLRELRSGDTVILDGFSGTIVVNPDRSTLDDAATRAQQDKAFASKLRTHTAPSTTRCGEKLVFEANVELPEEVPAVLAANAAGIGLYRTEFLYINRSEPPSEDEQFEVFRDLAIQMQGRAVTLRTFDLGGDKFASSFALPPELNPALGLRAVRLALRTPKVFLAHLRAMVRAAAYGEIRIMVPMVTTLDELESVRALLTVACTQVGHAGKAPPLGMMVEVPAAALLADHFATTAAFFSIGTNDLVQYTLAVDRTSRKVADLASPFDPAVLRLIHLVIQAGVTADIPVALCGAMAQTPIGGALLVGLGLRRFSMGAGAIAEVREGLSRVTAEECAETATFALQCRKQAEVHALLNDAFSARFHDLSTRNPQDLNAQ
jgi:phosphoenolpyruvate-protein phosphotransferase (PTS system enzyme I)